MSISPASRFVSKPQVATAQSSDSIEELAAVPDDRNAEVLQGPLPSGLAERLIYLVFAERCLIFSKAETPQPNGDIHGASPT